MAKQAKCGGSGFTRLDNSDEPGCSYCREAFSPSTRFGCKVPRSDRFSTSECCCDVPAEECEEACRKADQLPLVGELVSAGSSKKTAAEEHHSAIWTGISWWPNKWNPFREATVGHLGGKECWNFGSVCRARYRQVSRCRSCSAEGWGQSVPHDSVDSRRVFAELERFFSNYRCSGCTQSCLTFFHSHGTAWDLFDIHHWQCVRQWDR